MEGGRERERGRKTERGTVGDEARNRKSTYTQNYIH